MEGSNRSKVALIGFSGVGKTRTAGHLSRELGLPLVDLDLEVEKATGRPITEIIRVEGLEEFRRLESSLFKAKFSKNFGVLALGGGALLASDIAAEINRNFFVILLDARPKTLAARLLSDEKLANGSQLPKRPLIFNEISPQGKTCESDVLKRIAELSRERKSLYSIYDVKLITDLVDSATAAKIAAVAIKARKHADKSEQNGGAVVVIPSALPSPHAIPRITIIGRHLLAERGNWVFELTSLWKRNASSDARPNEEKELTVMFPQTLARQISLDYRNTFPADAERENKQSGESNVEMPDAVDLVFCDIDVLSTLSVSDYQLGLLGVIKIAAISDPELFVWLEQNTAAIKLRDPKTLMFIIESCVRRSQELLSGEDRETWNFVCRFGRVMEQAISKALEKQRISETNVSALACLLTTEIGFRIGVTETNVFSRLKILLRELALPVIIPEVLFLELQELLAGGDTERHGQLLDLLDGTSSRSGTNKVEIVLVKELGIAKKQELTVNEILTSLEQMRESQGSVYVKEE